MSRARAMPRAAALVSSSVALLITVATAPDAAPPTEYAAEQTTQVGAMTVVAKIHVKGDNVRNETRQGAQEAVTIMRRDKGRVWIVWPAMRAYVDQALPAADPRYERDPAAKEEREVMGRERIGDYDTEKIKVTSKSLKGEPIVHYEWAAKALGGLVIRRKTDLGQVDLRKIVIAAQPAELFEVPAGYRELRIGAPATPAK
jgi:hypothetical protein